MFSFVTVGGRFREELVILVGVVVGAFRKVCAFVGEEIDIGSVFVEDGSKGNRDGVFKSGRVAGESILNSSQCSTCATT